MLKGKRVLVVEDEPIVAMMIEDILEELSALTVGPALTVADATGLIEAEQIDVAILDVNLGKERSDAVAELLRQRGIPLVFATGYGPAGFGDDGAEVIEKPYGREHIAAALERAMGSG